MTTADLLADLVARGVRFDVAEGRLRVNAPVGVLGDSDREVLLRHKPALLDLLTTPERSELPLVRSKSPSPPAGSPLFFQDDAGRPCRAEDAYMWTWSGGPTWYYSREHPPPGMPRAM